VFCVVVFHKKKMLPSQVVLPGGERVGGWVRGAGALPAISCPVTVPRAATVYCMNEAELVDVALGVLAEVSPRLPFTPSTAKACSGSQEEQDLQQVEQELQAAPSQAPGERTDLDDSEDDALKYVREIFFT
uniref:Cell cycle regulator of NHEJ n=1 Tax=Pavo cristatus TaxID=9049 RepID=A0A8C9FS90_PAVCR